MLTSRRFPRRALLIAVLAVAPLAAEARGKLEASYTVTLAGIPIGKGDWTLEVSDTRYVASASGRTTGLMRVLTGGHGETNANGSLTAGVVSSSSYESSITSHKKTDSVHLKVNGGDVAEAKLDPPQDKDPQRVPVKETDEHGITDPMSASLLASPGTGTPVSPDVCQRTLSIFDGRIRYDLQLAYKRMEQVKAEQGYAGPVVVCAVYFTPIAGYVPSRTAIRYIAKMRDMEVWLAPIAGTRILVPFRAQGPTPIGEVVFAADRFVSQPLPVPASLKIQ